MITRERLRDIGAPGLLVELMTGPGFEERPALSAAAEAANRGGLVVLAGPSGSGKSTAAAFGAACCRRPGRAEVALIRCDNPEPGAFLGFDGTYYRREPIDLGGAEMRGVWMPASTAFESIFDEAYWTTARRAGVLVLDDLGLEVQDARVRDRIVGLLVERYDAARPTLVTTNLGMEAFRKTYAGGAGERLVRRMRWIQVAQFRNVA